MPASRDQRAPIRLAAFLAVLAAAGVSVAPSPPAPAAAPFVYPMVFPLVGPRAIEAHLTQSFGDPRSGGRHHEGVDILAPKLTPVVAVADGTVRWLYGTRGGNCCDLAIVHDDGWRSRYIHLNNDTPGTDDGEGYGIARGIRVGARVRAGQVIGYVGDSGNAENTVPHLHFELRRPDGTAVDPYPSLVAAEANPATSPAPRIAGPPVSPHEDVAPEILRPGKAPEAAPAEPAAPGAAPGPEEEAQAAAGEGRAQGAPPPALARPLPVTPFLPVPEDDCAAGLDAEIRVAEVAKPSRPTLSCFHFGSDEGSEGKK